MFDLAYIAIALIVSGVGSSPFTAVSGNNNTYVFSQLGVWNDPICIDSHSVEYDLSELLEGTFDEALCYATFGFSGSAVEVLSVIREDGFELSLEAEGLIYDKKDVGAFCRHDCDGLIVFDSEVNRRVRIELSLSASGLGSLQMTYRRIGNAGGGGGGSQPVVNESLNAYIDPVSSENSWVFEMPAGRWRVTFYTSHQCTNSTEGFDESTAELNFKITVVNNGDVDGNGVVDTEDLLSVISAWGSCESCQEDLNGDGNVNVRDILTVIGGWG